MPGGYCVVELRGGGLLTLMALTSKNSLQQAFRGSPTMRLGGLLLISRSFLISQVQMESVEVARAGLVSVATHALSTHITSLLFPN